MTAEYRARGAAADLFRCSDREILIEGPSGTGESRACLELAHYRAEQFPRSRILLLRKARARLAQSVLVTFEGHVLPEGHPVLTPVSRAHRESYRYPNGSEIVTGGMDDPTRIMSTDYDLVIGFEATELLIEDWERAMTRLRNNKIPHPEIEGTYLNQIIADVNPASEYHWLNQRAGGGLMTRLLSRHEDNPTCTPEYLSTLRSLTGHRRSRLYEGLWTSAEGLIWPEFDPAIHILDHRLNFNSQAQRWQLTPPPRGSRPDHHHLDPGCCGLGLQGPRLAARDWSRQCERCICDPRNLRG